MDYQERLLNELIELSIRSQKLLDFIEKYEQECNNGKEMKHQEYYDMLTEQASIMSDYEYILTKRIIYEMKH